MTAILLVKQMDLVACLTVNCFAFLSISVHSKCDFAQPTADGKFLQGMHCSVIETNSVAIFHTSTCSEQPLLVCAYEKYWNAFTCFTCHTSIDLWYGWACLKYAAGSVLYAAPSTGTHGPSHPVMLD